MSCIEHARFITRLFCMERHDTLLVLSQTYGSVNIISSNPKACYTPAFICRFKPLHFILYCSAKRPARSRRCLPMDACRPPMRGNITGCYLMFIENIDLQSNGEKSHLIHLDTLKQYFANMWGHHESVTTEKGGGVCCRIE